MTKHMGRQSKWRVVFSESVPEAKRRRIIGNTFHVVSINGVQDFMLDNVFVRVSFAYFHFLPVLSMKL